jgi:hypothetical protein
MPTRFVANLAVIQWIWSGGTISLQGDYRKLDITTSVKEAVVTAGPDAREGRLPTIKDTKVAIQVVADVGGTAVLAALAEGNVGTLIIGPEGTATSKPKTTVSAICQGADQHYAYATESLIDCTFDGDGVTYTQGNY